MAIVPHSAVVERVAHDGTALFALAQWPGGAAVLATPALVASHAGDSGPASTAFSESFPLDAAPAGLGAAFAVDETAFYVFGGSAAGLPVADARMLLFLRARGEWVSSLAFNVGSAGIGEGAIIAPAGLPFFHVFHVVRGANDEVRVRLVPRADAAGAPRRVGLPDADHVVIRSPAPPPGEAHLFGAAALVPAATSILLLWGGAVRVFSLAAADYAPAAADDDAKLEEIYGPAAVAFSKATPTALDLRDALAPAPTAHEVVDGTVSGSFPSAAATSETLRPAVFSAGAMAAPAVGATYATALVAIPAVARARAFTLASVAISATTATLSFDAAPAPATAYDPTAPAPAAGAQPTTVAVPVASTPLVIALADPAEIATSAETGVVQSLYNSGSYEYAAQLSTNPAPVPVAAAGPGLAAFAAKRVGAAVPLLPTAPLADDYAVGELVDATTHAPVGLVRVRRTALLAEGSVSYFTARDQNWSSQIPSEAVVTVTGTLVVSLTDSSDPFAEHAAPDGIDAARASVTATASAAGDASGAPLPDAYDVEWAVAGEIVESERASTAVFTDENTGGRLSALRPGDGLTVTALATPRTGSGALAGSASLRVASGKPDPPTSPRLASPPAKSHHITLYVALIVVCAVCVTAVGLVAAVYAVHHAKVRKRIEAERNPTPVTNLVPHKRVQPLAVRK